LRQSNNLKFPAGSEFVCKNTRLSLGRQFLAVLKNILYQRETVRELYSADGRIALFHNGYVANPQIRQRKFDFVVGIFVREFFICRLEGCFLWPGFAVNLYLQWAALQPNYATSIALFTGSNCRQYYNIQSRIL
jgi:hypothetical protein